MRGQGAAQRVRRWRNSLQFEKRRPWLGGLLPSLQGRVVRTNLVIGAAGYPEDGLNMHQLYVKAQKVVDYAQKHDIHGYAEFKEQVHGQESERPKLSVKSTKR